MSASAVVWLESEPDPLFEALYAAQAAYLAHDAYTGAGNAIGGMQGQAVPGNTNTDGSASASGAQGGANAGGISLRVGIGSSSSNSKTTTHDDQAYGSHIRSQGDVTIAATGGDLNIIGSQVSGNNIALAAKNNLNLLSQTEQHTDKSDSHNGSGEIGISIGSTTGIYLSASAGQAKAHGNGTTHAETVVDAKDTLTLVSGNDTNIIGAQAKGNTVLASIGGNLNVASQQDTDDYASKYIQAGITLVYGWSGGGAGVSGSLAMGKTDSHYASVTDMSGIGAGNGGYQIHVGGNTDLKGAVIASTADPGRNWLDTGSLTFSDIQNKASYSSYSVSVGGGYGSGGSSFSGGIGIPQHDNESSTTKAGIAQGTITVRENPGQDLSGLNRDPNLDNQALKGIFDQQKVQERQELGQVAGYVGMRTVGAIADHFTSPYQDAALTKARAEAALEKETDPDKRAQLEATIVQAGQAMSSSQANTMPGRMVVPIKPCSMAWWVLQPRRWGEGMRPAVC